MKYSLLVVLALGCQDADPVQTPAAHAPAAQTPAQAPAEAPAAGDQEANPRAFLETLRERVSSSEIDSVGELLFESEISERMLAGIREGRPRGDFAFSPPGLEALIARADEFVVATDDTPGARRFSRSDPRMADIGSLRVFNADGAYVVLFASPEGLRLVFWENLTRLARP